MFARLLSRATALPARLHNLQRRGSADVLRPQRHLGNRSERGQSLVEFALVLPMLLVLLLGVADFGRVFAAGITLESAARAGAEAAALERLKNPPSIPGDTSYYQALHELAARTVCHEARLLPESDYDAGDPAATPPIPESCPTMPVIAVCVHDGGDPLCDSASEAITLHSGTVPDECTEIKSAYNPVSGGPVQSHWVEVRVCYQFRTLMPLHFALPFNAGLSLGDVWLQRDRGFVIDCPRGDVSTC